MPKKRKARRPNIPLYTGPVPLEDPTPAPTLRTLGGVNSAASLAVRAGPATAAGTIKADYSHVVSDLKRIAVLGGGLVAILIALSFFLR